MSWRCGSAMNRDVGNVEMEPTKSGPSGRGERERTSQIRRDHPLPVVLTCGETRRLLGSVRSGRFRASAVQNALRMALSASGLKENATCHTLRHSFATNLLEDGVTIRRVSTYLGHASLATTLVYFHLTGISESRGGQVQERLLQYILEG